MRRLATSFLLLIASANVAFAWGQEGHSVVAEIAQRRLNADAASMVTDLLGNGVSLASVASWADDIRDARPETYNWHFVDIPMAAADYVPSRDCPSTGKGDCIVAEIERARIAVHCATDKAARAEALKLLVHFVGDLHQPFHTVKEETGMNGHGVTTRMGGETCGKTCGFNQLKSTDDNLHAVWDGSLIRKQAYDWGAYVDRLETGWLKTADVAAVDQGDVISWAAETHGVAQKVFGDEPPDNFLDDDYFKEEIPVVDQQLGRAGLRLAKLLNDKVSCP